MKTFFLTLCLAITYANQARGDEGVHFHLVDQNGDPAPAVWIDIVNARRVRMQAPGPSDPNGIVVFSFKQLFDNNFINADGTVQGTMLVSAIDRAYDVYKDASIIRKQNAKAGFVVQLHYKFATNIAENRPRPVTTQQQGLQASYNQGWNSNAYAIPGSPALFGSIRGPMVTPGPAETHYSYRPNYITQQVAKTCYVLPTQQTTLRQPQEIVSYRPTAAYRMVPGSSGAANPSIILTSPVVASPRVEPSVCHPPVLFYPPIQSLWP